MADSETDRPREAPNEPRGGGFWMEWLRPRRVIEFLRNIINWERSIRHLEEENRSIRMQIVDLQRQVVAQDAKLQLLVDFVKDSLNERIDTRTELVVRRLRDRDRGYKGE
jgi:hypothetical protein